MSWLGDLVYVMDKGVNLAKKDMDFIQLRQYFMCANQGTHKIDRTSLYSRVPNEDPNRRLNAQRELMRNKLDSSILVNQF